MQNFSQFSHLNERRFRYGFVDMVSPMCGCNAEIENNECLFLCGCLCSTERFFKPFFTQLGTQEQINILLYGYPPEQIEYLQRRYYQVCN